MKKEMSIINALEESASEFACKFSACQQEVMLHEEGVMTLLQAMLGDIHINRLCSLDPEAVGFV